MKKAIVTLLALMMVFSMVAFAEGVSSKTTADTTTAGGVIEVIKTADNSAADAAAAVEQTNAVAEDLYNAAQASAGEGIALTAAISEILGNVQSLNDGLVMLENLSVFKADDKLTVDVVVPAKLATGTATITDQTVAYHSDSRFAVLFKVNGSDLYIQLLAAVDENGNIVVTIPEELNGVAGTTVIVSAV